jgi:hypothetical protein
MSVTAEEIAADILGMNEEPSEEAPQVEEQPETVEEVEETTSSEVAEEVSEVVEEEDTKVPLKALVEERRKRQEYEAKLKEIEEKVNAQTPKEPPTIEQLYETDPQGTTSRINAEIARLQNDDPFGNAEAIERLRDLKIELRETSIINKQNGQTKALQEQQAFVNELTAAIPDLPKKTQALTEFAMTEMGMTDEALQRLSNPQLVGKEAAKAFITMVNKQYEQKQAATSVRSKAVQPKPTSVESPGTGSRQSAENIGNLKAEAIRSGDWSRYLAATGVLD